MVRAAELTPQAKDAFEKGLAAAGQTEWIVAADNFNKAWKINKQSLTPWKTEPEIIFNWGLAESKIPGRELQAITCFNLFLDVAGKEAANTEAVRKEKVLLEVREEGRLKQLFAQAKKFITQLQGDDELRRRVADGGYDWNGTIASLRRHAYRRVARAQARAGDFTGAVQTAELCKIPPHVNLVTSNILFFHEYGGIDRTLFEDIAKMQAEAEKPEKQSDSMVAQNLRDLLVHANFNKASLTDPAGALQSLAGKRKPEDLFDGYMQVIEDRIFVLRRAPGQRGVHILD
jgi:hypothetical protein